MLASLKVKKAEIVLAVSDLAGAAKALRGL